MNGKEGVRSNKTLAAKLEAVNRTSPKRDKMKAIRTRSSNEVQDQSHGERFEAVSRSRYREVEPVMNRGGNEAIKQGGGVGSKSSFWQGDGVWSSDQSTVFGSALYSEHKPHVDVVLREYGDARVEKQDSDASNHWRAAIDTSSGSGYYHNKKTKETSLSLPSGFNGSVGGDKEGKNSEEQTKNLRNVVNNRVVNLVFQDVDLNRARTQRQRGGGAVTEDKRDGMIDSRASHSKKQLQTVPAVNVKMKQMQFPERSPDAKVLMSRRKKLERDQYYSISQLDKSIGRRLSQQHHSFAAAAPPQDQDKKSSRRRRFTLYRKKKEGNSTSTTNTRHVANNNNNNKSYIVSIVDPYVPSAKKVDPASPNRTADASLESSDDSREYVARGGGGGDITTFSC